MKKWIVAATVLAAPVAAANAAADCPPLHGYRVMNITLTNGTMQHALNLLLAGTPWHGAVQGIDDLALSFRAVSGPLDAVLRETAQRAGTGAANGVNMSIDAARCLVTVAIAAPSKPEPKPDTPMAQPLSLTTPTAAASAATPLSERRAADVSLRGSAPEPIARNAAPPVGWTANRGTTLRAVIEGWAAKEKWVVHWESQDVNYEITAPLRFDGALLDAVEQILALHGTADRPLYARGYIPQNIIDISETPL